MTDELPAIITDVRMLPSFYQMMIKNGRIEDLTPYINEDEEWKDMIEPSVMEVGPGRGWKDLSGSGQHGGIRLFRGFLEPGVI